MPYVKRLVMQGFKSFVKKTEIPFTPEINVILGPNGSGKSNVMDALCFVLGRLSIKSMRAAKAKNLIFMGSKTVGPAKEATVEIVFDNEENIFSVEGSELSIKRTVRKNGQSIYKINNHIKTRQEVLSVLAQAGIDPHGFNIILQGEIQNFVRMHTEERRKIIEEVSGIAIYESRKQKSLKELTKTEEKLKEIGAILKERTIYLNNLEKERQQALKYKKLEEDIKKFRVSILSSDLNKTLKESSVIDSDIEKKNKEIDKIKTQITKIEAEIMNAEAKIVSINSTMQQSTGLEQEKLNREITNLRASLAGVNVNIENNEKKLSQLVKQKADLNQTIIDGEESISKIKNEMSGKKPKKKEDKQKEVDSKTRSLDNLEEQKKKFYMMRTELKSTREKINEKKLELQNNNSDVEFITKQIRSFAREIFDKNTTEIKIDALKVSLSEKKHLLNDLRQREIELEKISYNNEYEIERQNKLIANISKMDTCPICKSKITEKHIHEIKDEINPKIEVLGKQVSASDRELGQIYERKKIFEQEIEKLIDEINKRDSDLIKLQNVNEKEKQIKSTLEKINLLEGEISMLSRKQKEFEKRLDQDLDIEQRYETLRLEIQEISILDSEDLDSEVLFRKRELERSKISLKQILREEIEIKEELTILISNKNKNLKELEIKNKQEEELTKKFQKLIEQRDELGRKIRQDESISSQEQNKIYNLDKEINDFKIEKARVNAITENLQSELIKYPGIEIIKMPKEKLVEKLVSTQEAFDKIGTVNMRSLEVYEEIQKEYESVQTKVNIIEKEKEGILRIIHQIDIKKKKTFLKTLTEINEIFSRNFSQLSTKGQVYLELEDKKEPFEGGVTIVVKTGHGKYFDVTSLSGGEQTIVALSLIFAIQELNPYAFYVLDEIDAALDKRNSERLANLLKRYMAKGQYIVISHNDEVINQASTLYGVSMHDGLSKVVSLKV